MVVTRGAQKALAAFAAVLIAVVYVFAWMAPAVGLYYDDAVNLVTARALIAGHGYSIESLPVPVAQTKVPPLFPALLGLFSVISLKAQWLKMLPLACAFGWLFLTWRLLRRLGASPNSALFVVAVSAASPTVIFLASNLFPELLFGLVATACLLILIDGRRPALAGAFAGLAAVTIWAGLTLVVAGAATLLMNRRFSGAVRFTFGAMVFAAPWVGWAAAHGGGGIVGEPGLWQLSAGDGFRVLALNCMAVFSAPYTLITGFQNVIGLGVTVVILLCAVIFRRQLVPDLSVILYCLLILTFVAPPYRLLAPLLPLALWIVWRWIDAKWSPELVAAIMIVTIIAQVAVDFQRLPPTWRSGVFALSGKSTDEWDQVLILSKYLQTETPASAVVLANLDPVIFLQSGRHAVRGFRPNGFDLYFSPVRRPVQAFQIAKAIRDSRVDYVAVTPDRDLIEAPGFQRAVHVLEREGAIEPVPVSGLHAEYSLWRVSGQ